MLRKTKAVRKVMVAFFAILMMSSVTGTVAAAEATSDVEIHNSTRSNRGAVVGDGGEITAHIITRKIPTGVDGGENGTDVKAHILIRKIPTGVDGGDDDEEITIIYSPKRSQHLLEMMVKTLENEVEFTRPKRNVKLPVASGW